MKAALSESNASISLAVCVVKGLKSRPCSGEVPPTLFTKIVSGMSSTSGCTRVARSEGLKDEASEIRVRICKSG